MIVTLWWRYCHSIQTQVQSKHNFLFATCFDPVTDPPPHHHQHQQASPKNGMLKIEVPVLLYTSIMRSQNLVFFTYTDFSIIILFTNKIEQLIFAC